MAWPSLNWNNETSRKNSMQELFYEECAQVQNAQSLTKKYNLFKAISIFFYVLTGLWTFAFLFLYIINVKNPLFDIIIYLIPTALFLSTAILIGIYKYWWT